MRSRFIEMFGSNKYPTIKIGDLFVTSSGGTPSSKESLYYENGDIPWITSGDVNIGLITKANNFITELGMKNSSAKLIPSNCVLVAMYGATVGAVSLLKIEATTNQAVCAIHPNDKYDSEFLYHVLKSKKQILMNMSKGGAQPNISQTIIRNLNIENPPLSLQKKYTQFAKQIDKSKFLLQQMIEKLELLKKSRFIEMFGNPITNSKKWDTAKIKDIAPEVRASTTKEEQVWLLNLDCIEPNSGRILSYTVVNKEEIGDSTFPFDTNNVLYSKLRPYLNKVVVPTKTGYATSELVPLKPNQDRLTKDYLAYFLRSDEFVRMISEKVAGAKMPRVSMPFFRNFLIPIPPLERQNEFSSFAQQIDKSKAILQKQLDDLVGSNK